MQYKGYTIDENSGLYWVSQGTTQLASDCYPGDFTSLTDALVAIDVTELPTVGAAWDGLQAVPSYIETQAAAFAAAEVFA